jgi:hypothetical protein
VEVVVGVERHASAVKTTDFALFAPHRAQRLNPGVDEGTLGIVRARAIIGEPGSAWSVVSQRGVEVEVERCVRGLFGSRFSFTAYRVEATLGIATFLRRRLLPNRLDVKVVAGMLQGEAPVQRLGTIDGRLALLTPFGTLRTRDGWYHGDRYIALFWEHNFRTLPFELLGLRWLVSQGVGLSVHGAVAGTWLRDGRQSAEAVERCPQGVHQEVGVAVTGILGFLRCDVTRRLHRAGWAIGFGLARLY